MKKSFKLSVLMPVFNEKKTVLQMVKRVLDSEIVDELVIVDDGSTDGTTALLKKLKQSKRIKIYYHPKNLGKGAAIVRALKEVHGDYVIIQDADLEYDPTDYAGMIEPVVAGKAEVVYGSRFYGPHKNMLFWHKLANDSLNLLINILFDTTISDCESCYKLIPVTLIRSLRLESRRFDFEIEVTCKILKHGLRIYEVPISYSGREYKDGKKIKFSDGILAFIKVLQYRLL